MYWIFHFIFFSLIFGCWAADSEELQPLKIPDEIKMDGSRATLANMFKTFNINYLRSKFVPSTKTKEASISQRLLTTAGQLANSYKSLYSTNQFSKACDWRRAGLTKPAKVTKIGEDVCSKKCKAENDEYVKYVNYRLPSLFKILNKPNLIAQFKATDEDFHECAPGFVYGFTCVCKSHVEALVNEDLQSMIDEVFLVKKEEQEGADGENAKKKKENKNKSNIVGRFFGLFFVITFFPSWTYSYILWWYNIAP